MNKVFSKLPSLILILAMLVNALPMQSVQAAPIIIAQWNFEIPNPADVTDAAIYPNAIAPAIGLGNASGVHASATTDWSTPVGNGSADSFSSNNWAVGDYYQFSISTTGFTGVSVSWDQTRSSTGPSQFKIAYSTDGTTFTDFGSSYTIPANAWSSSGTPVSTSNFTFDLSSITALDNNATIYFRLINTIASGGTSGTNRVDNFTVSGTAITATPTVNLLVDTNNASEADQTIVTVTATANSAVVGDQTVDLSVSGTGITAGDYFLSNAVITISDGSATGSVTFTVVDDTEIEGTETATLTISNPSSGISLGATMSQNVTITDNDDIANNILTITTQPQSQTINSGETASLGVVASGTDTPLSYQWYQGNTGDTSTPVGTDSPSFTTPALTSTTSYWVRVTDFNLDSVDSVPATITVAPPVPTTIKIHEVQGNGSASPLVGQAVIVEGIVVAAFPGSTKLNGFYMQEEDADVDADSATSEGVFVYDTAGLFSGSVGDKVRVTGPVTEYTTSTANIAGTGNSSLTQITSPTNVTVVSSGNPLPTDVNVTLPLTDASDLERYEGMLVNVSSASGSLVVTETFKLGRYGQVGLSGSVRLNQFTQVSAPSVSGYADYLANLQDNYIILDDASTGQNPATVIHARGGQPLSATNTLRGGDTITSINGVLDHRFEGYRVQTTTPANFNPTNVREATAPSVGGDLRVASGNLLNFFNGNGIDANNDGFIDGGFPTSRGANTAVEFKRQIDKSVQEVLGLNADVFGYNEIENDGYGADSAVQELVDALNAATAPGTYAFVTPSASALNASGRFGGDEITVGFIYKTNTARVAPGTSAAALTTGIFDQVTTRVQRPALAVTFERLANGNPTNETFTAVINHFKSKGSAASQPGDADQNDGQGFSNATRVLAAQQLAAWLATNPTGTTDADCLILGDLNSYRLEDPITVLISAGYISLFGSESYSYQFNGQWGSLDHALANASLNSQVTGTAKWHINSDEPTVLDYNTEFKSAGQVNSFYNIDPFRTSDHDPIVVGLNLTAPTYTLQILHASDWEAGLTAIQDAPNFAAVVDYFDNTYSNTLILSSGDNYIPGTFFNAGGDPALNAVLGVASVGRADMEMLNRIGVEASAFGNHDFDAGTREVSNIIAASGAWRGAQFPYLSSNLTFTTDSNLSGLNRAGGLEASSIKGKVAPSAIITKNGEKIGLVGVTTPMLANISSPGTVGVSPSNPEDMAALAAIVQPAIDSLIAGGANKIIVLAHMQQISYEQALAPLLRGVDVVLGGGSNTLLADATDRLRAGDAADGSYPLSFTNADGDPGLIVNTDGNYKYVGRLVVDFDATGKLIPGSYDAAESGAYATDNQGVQDLWGNLTDPFAAGTKGAAVKQVADAVAGVINLKDAVIYGHTDVYLNGLRAEVRTEETNLGNLSADANLAQAKLTDPTAVVSIKNGGGIRDSIGSTEDVFDVNGNVIDVNRVKTVANPAAGKNAGDISQLDIENSLRFNNDLSMITVSAENLKRILEHSVAATTATGTPGQFPQIGGIAFSFDRTKPAQVMAGNSTTGIATVTTEGQRIRNAALIDENGLVIEKIVENGVVVGDPNRLIRIVTLRFLVASTSNNGLGGDSYPFPTFGTNRVDMGVFEQTAFSNYITAKYALSAPAYNVADTPASLDTRIQNLTVRSDTIFTNTAPTAVTLQNKLDTLPENSNTASAIKVADIVVTDDALGTNILSLSGPDAGVFELNGSALYLKAGTVLDFETKSSYAVVVEVDDATVGSTPDATANYALNITDVNDAPSSVNAGGPYSANEGSSVLLVTATGSDPDNDTLTYAWDLDNNGSFETAGQSVNFAAGSQDGPASYTINVRATDPGNLSLEASATVNIVNTAPTATFVTPIPVNEGTNFAISLDSAVDPSAADTSAGFTYAFDCGSGYGAFGSSNTATCVAVDNPGATVKAKIQDKDGGFTEYTATVVINNVAPVIVPITVPASPVKVGTTVNTSASFTDLGKLDTHSAVWNWGDGSTSNGIVTEVNGSGSATGSHSYTKAGFYTVSLTVTDKDGSTHQATYQTIIVYNPNGGYVTAGGWYYSSAGAYLEKPTKKGTALTTFVVAYPRNASKPSGQFNFNFPAGNLRFEASSFDWMIVDQVTKTAQFQGSGKINRQGTFKFMVWANGNKPNSIRIKIWKPDGTVVYDNGTPSLMGGSIIIHR